MPADWSNLVPPIILCLLSVILLTARLSRGRLTLPGSLDYLWAFFLVFTIAARVSFALSVWLLAIISFRALREYLSLVDLRLEDRWGILGAYLSIPFMFYLIQINWYGFFIVSIPVYTFLIVPFLVMLGGRSSRGCVLSIGAIDFGLFLLVYCVGHIGYLLWYSIWKAIFLVVAVAVCDCVARYCGRRGDWLRGYLLAYVLAAPVVLGLGYLLMTWTGIPRLHTVILSLMLPVLVLMGRFTISGIENDLGIAGDRLTPGRGEVLDSLQSYLFTAPVVFHYLRWFLKLDSVT